MANQNVEVVLRFAEGFKARDIDAIVEHVAEDCEVVALHSEVKGTFVGRDGVRRWVETFIETVPDVEVALERIITVDENRVLAFGTAHPGDASYAGPLALTLEIVEGKLKRVSGAPKPLSE